MTSKNRQAIGVIGQGFVGGTLAVGMCHVFDVYAYDKARSHVSAQGRGTIREPAKKSIAGLIETCERDPNVDFTGVYFVCVPTPMFEDGEADLRIVEGVLDELADRAGERIAVVKSTVPPGSTESWNEKYEDTGLTVVFNPEFLTEANALDDFLNQNRIIVGGPRPATNTVKQVFQAAYPKVPTIKTSSTCAEMVKYVINCFLATKVSFANEIYDICQALDNHGLDIDYDKVIEYVKYDSRVGDSHWAVPGPCSVDGRYVRGFGGHCFPKDLNALMYLATALEVNPTVLDAVWKKNLDVRPEEDRDWERMHNRAVSRKEKNK
jgi:UDPglucose 6-dehydrogenase